MRQFNLPYGVLSGKLPSKSYIAAKSPASSSLRLFSAQTTGRLNRSVPRILCYITLPTVVAQLCNFACNIARSPCVLITVRRAFLLNRDHLAAMSSADESQMIIKVFRIKRRVKSIFFFFSSTVHLDPLTSKEERYRDFYYG